MGEIYAFSGTLLAAGRTPFTVPYGMIGRIKAVVVQNSATVRAVTINDIFTPSASNTQGAPVSQTIALMNFQTYVATAAENTIFDRNQLGDGIRCIGAVQVIGTTDAGVIVTVYVEFV